MIAHVYTRNPITGSVYKDTISFSCPTVGMDPKKIMDAAEKEARRQYDNNVYHINVPGFGSRDIIRHERIKIGL